MGQIEGQSGLYLWIMPAIQPIIAPDQGQFRTDLRGMPGHDLGKAGKASHERFLSIAFLLSTENAFLL